jgi:hypothetical protein
LGAARTPENRKLRRAINVLFACELLLVLIPPVSGAQTWTWRTETVDEGGKFTSIAVDKDQNLHLSFSDGHGSVKYAFRPAGASSKWFTMVLDGGDAFTNLALDAHGNPHICFPFRVLKYGRWDGKSWQIQTIGTDAAPISFSCAVGVSPDGTPHVSWYRDQNADNTAYTHIKYAELQNSVWVIHTLDFEMQTGKWESMAIDSQGNPHLSFDAFVKGLLRYAHKDGKDWKVETVDFRGHTDDAYNLGMGNSIALEPDGKPVISYEDGQYLKCARLEGNSWKIDRVDQVTTFGSWVGYRTSLALDKQSFPHIVYDDAGSLKHAFWDGRKWHIERLASSGTDGYRYGSLAIDQENNLYVSYRDPDDGSLRVAFGQWKAGPAQGTVAEEKKN